MLVKCKQVLLILVVGPSKWRIRSHLIGFNYISFKLERMKTSFTVNIYFEKFEVDVNYNATPTISRYDNVSLMFLFYY